MARAPSLSFSRAGLSPFKRTGAAFSMFSVVDTDNEAYLQFTKVDVQWQAGNATDDEYMAALRTYADSFDHESAEYFRAQERVRETQYSIDRDKLISQINKGTKSMDDLLTFDTQAMMGLDPGNQEYRTRRDRLSDTTNKAAYDSFNKIREQWQNGLVKDTDYLSAFETYVGKLTVPAEIASAQMQLNMARYTLARNALVTAINKGNRSIGDLLSFDQQALTTGVIPGSDEYRQRFGRLQESQRAVFADQEQSQNLAWQQGRMTTNQLLRWYEDSMTNNLASGNQELVDRITSQVDSLRMRVQDERDSKMVDDFNNGRVGANAFLAYARDARDRYLSNTPQYRDWQTRLDDATKRTTEDNLLYRYELTNNYADLKRFVATHKKAPWEGGSTSDDTRWVLQDDGTWKPETTTTTTPYTPTQDQRDAWAEIQAQIAESKAQMRYIEQQISTVPGGWVNNQHILNYYSGIQHDYVAGSSEWYQVQQKIDQVHEAISQENVYKTIGITVTYPWTATDPQNRPGTRSPDAYDPNRPNPNPGANRGPRGYNNPGPSTSVTQGNKYWGNAPVRHAAGTDPHGNGISVDEFLYALGQHESGNNYSAQNGQTGAFGKYQHLPQYWASRARKFLGDANAPMTPENQEKVTRAMVTAIYNRWGDWRTVALIWHGGAGAAQKHDVNDPSTWSLRNQKYVNRTMNILGSDMWTPTNQQGVFLPNDWTASGGTPPSRGPHPGSVTPGGPHSAPYDPNAPYTPPARPGSEPGAQNPRSPDTQERPNPPPTHGPQFLRYYTNTTHTDAFGALVPTTRSTGIPDWASDNSLAGTNFEDFYGEFLKAFNNGDTSVTFFRQGKTTTYALPGDPQRRQAMMAQLDSIRIDLHGTRAAAYWAPGGDTDMARTADALYETSVKQQGANMLRGMLQPDYIDPEDAYSKFRAGERGDKQQGPNLNPIADADTYLKSSQAYIDMHTRLAQEAYDRGDFTSAIAHINRAATRQDETDIHMNTLIGEANSLVSQIQGSTGTDLPESVRVGLDKLNNWDSELDLSDMEALSKELIGTQTTRGVVDGTWLNPTTFVPNRDQMTGNIILRKGIQLVFDSKGNVTYDEVPEPVLDPRTGLPIGPAVGNRVPTTTKIGNTMEVVYADAEVGEIGKFSDGTIIYGRRTYDQRMGRWVYENPFQPGKWSTSIIVYNLPPGAQAVPFDPNHPATTQIAWRDAQGTQWGLTAAPDQTGAYLLTNLTNGLSFRTDDTNFSVNDVLAQSGFNRDVSFVSVADRSFLDTSGPVFGMSPGDYNKYLNTSLGASPNLGRLLERPPDVVSAIQKSLDQAATPQGAAADARESAIFAAKQLPKTVSAVTRTAVDAAIAFAQTPGGIAADDRESTIFAARTAPPPIAPSARTLPAITPPPSTQRAPTLPPHVTQSQAAASSAQEHLGGNRNKKPTQAELDAAKKQRDRYKLQPYKPPKVTAPKVAPTKKIEFFDRKDTMY